MDKVQTRIHKHFAKLLRRLFSYVKIHTSSEIVTE